MQRFVVEETNKRYDVYINLASSPAGLYLSRNPHLIALIREVLSRKELRGQRIIVEKDMGRGIGRTDVVSTSDEDTIYYAQALGSEVFLRFAKKRYPQKSNILTVIVERDADGNYEVSNIWIGASHPAFPGDEFEAADSKVFWKSHALVQDAFAVQSKSITKICPY